MKDIYVLVDKILSLCDIDPYVNPPRHEGLRHVLAAAIRAFIGEMEP